ncbi:MULTISPECIES: DUF3592 domain-containing protein [unclassified Pseudonocardia]|uniref:DUF3592 domain-containing protein n=1 Tax=unclassified Pseudonocardia TaxID=2619320 RepID=UPI001ACC4329|nr:MULTISPECIES: DUF3592 domain-containing protein [unclassified Pseudonocardia]MBN9100509.1 DUF3592 domain-containing protein [Pseudonocardia sp.]
MTPTGNTRTRAVDELADLVRPAIRAVSRSAPRIVQGVALVLTFMALFALIGAGLDDRTISANQAVAQAQVLDGSTFFRTLVQFTAADGQAHTPELGVFYPRGLEPGTTVAVEYDVTNPDLVRVAGRTFLSGVLPLGVGIVVVWAIAVPYSMWLRRRRL